MALTTSQKLAALERAEHGDPLITRLQAENPAWDLGMDDAGWYAVFELSGLPLFGGGRLQIIIAAGSPADLGERLAIARASMVRAGIPSTLGAT